MPSNNTEDESATKSTGKALPEMAMTRSSPGSRARNEFGLTPIEEAFAHAVAAGASYSEAYRRASPASARWKPEALWVKASQMAARDKVKIRVKLLSEAISNNSLHDASRLRDVAIGALVDTLDSPEATDRDKLRAAELIGKMPEVGLFAAPRPAKEVDRLGSEEIEARIRQLLAKTDLS